MKIRLIKRPLEGRNKAMSMEDKCSLCKGDKLADLAYGDSLGLCANCRIEVKQAERRGAERMIKLLNEHSPFVDDGTKITVCCHCMTDKKIWEAWEKQGNE
jgi:hypothetical protein